MRIDFKNILICIGVIVVTYMLFDVALSLLKINYTLNIIKEDGAVPLKDYEVYSDISTVLKTYFRNLKNQDFDKLKDMSLYYAKMSNEEYKEIANTLAIPDIFEIFFSNIHVLEENIYLCRINIKGTNSFSEDIKVVLKLNREEGYFRVLNLEIGEVKQ